MNINTKLEGITLISLSRRNLVGLLSQLDAGKKGDPAQIMRHTEAGLLLVVAEEDAEHYNSPDREEVIRGLAGNSAPDQAFVEFIAP